jgi:hypothetical protein
MPLYFFHIQQEIPAKALCVLSAAQGKFQFVMQVNSRPVWRNQLSPVFVKSAKRFWCI